MTDTYVTGGTLNVSNELILGLSNGTSASAIDLSALVTDELNELIDANTNNTSVVLANQGAGVRATAGTGVGNFVAISGALSGTTGDDNIIIGRNAAKNKIGAADNIVMGLNALGSSSTSSPTKNIMIGSRTGFNLYSNAENIMIGFQAGSSSTSNDYSTIVGTYAGLYQYGDYQTIIGYRAGQDDTGYGGVTNSPTLLGAYAGYNVVGSGNIAIGSESGYNKSVVTQYSGTNNIILGNGVLLSGATTTRQLVVGGLDRYLLSGDFNTTDRTKLGVNISNDIPTANLQVKGHASDSTTVLIQDGSDNTLVSVDNVGNLHVTGRTTTENFTMLSGATVDYVLTSDGSGNARWAAAGGGGCSDLDCLSDVEIVLGAGHAGSAAQFNMFVSNGSTAGGAPQHGTLNDARANIGFGPNSAKALTSGDYNIGVGYQTLYSLTTGSSNIAIGYNAASTLSTTSNNVFVGHNAGYATTNAFQVGIGYGALGGGSIGGENSIAIGYAALSSCTYRNNIGIGKSAGYGITSGQGNTSIGYNSMYTTNTNSFCVALGYSSAPSTTTVSREFTIGYSTNAVLMRGTYATDDQCKLLINAQGAEVPLATLHVMGQGTTVSTTSLLVEDSGGNPIITVTDNKRLVYTDGNEAAGYVLTSDANGIGTWQAAGGGGASVLDDLTDVELAGSGVNWSFFKNGITPDGAPVHGTLSSAERNIALGANCLQALTSGDDNIAIGYRNGYALTTGSHNFYLGNSVAIANNGSENFAWGDTAMFTSTNSSYNIAFGTQALYFLNNGSGNLAMGYQAGRNMSTGGYNILLGYNGSTGTQVTTGSYNIALGYRMGVPSATASNQFVVGNGSGNKTLLSGVFDTANSAKLGINLGDDGVAVGASPNSPTATLHVKGEGLTVGTTSFLVEDSGGNDIIKITDNKRLVYTDGNEAAGYVLTSDVNGIATWQAAGGGGCSDIDCLTDGYTATNTLMLGSLTSTPANQIHTTIVGIDAGDSMTDADYCTILGYNAGTAITSGNANTIIGERAAATLTTGIENVYVGAASGLRVATGVNYNTCIGRFAGDFTGGNSNTYVGHQAGKGASASNVGTSNTFVGAGCGQGITTGDYNTMMAGLVGSAITTGSRNTLLGRVGAITTGNQNIGLGYFSFTNANGDSNILIGASDGTAAFNPTSATPDSEFWMGITKSATARVLMNGHMDAANQCKVGINNTSLPTATLHVKGQGATNATTALLVVDSGDNPLVDIDDSGANIFLGHEAGLNAPAAANSIYIGFDAGKLITTGTNNVGIGYNALAGSAGNVNQNVAIGTNAYKNAQAGGNQGVCVGYGAGSAITTGANNTFIGHSAGDNINTGGSNIIIGHGVDGSAVGVDNELRIGVGAVINISGNTATGDVSTGRDFYSGRDIYDTNLTSVTTVGTDADGKLIVSPSDKRLKKNILCLENLNPLEFIKSLHGYEFEWRAEANIDSVGGRKHYGFMADEIKSITINSATNIDGSKYSERDSNVMGNNDYSDRVNIGNHFVKATPTKFRHRDSQSIAESVEYVDYVDMIPWLVEGVKELSFDVDNIDSVGVEKFLTGGTYNSSTKEIELTLNTGDLITIPANDLLDNTNNYVLTGHYTNNILTLERKDLPNIDIPLSGLQGNTGPQGPAGNDGAAGAAGAKGDTGATGSQGPAGNDGAAGAAGAKGDTGDTGATGPAGNDGAAGAAGAKGDTGNTGPQGSAGNDGAAGAAGAKGDTGAAGPQGSAGNDGAAGAAGAKGDTGDTGATGPAGNDGADGSNKKYAASLSFTKNSVTTITHSLNEEDVIVQLKDSSGKMIIPDVVDNYTTNSVDITVSITGNYRVIIIG